jgi:hypothetical protein
MPTNLIPLSEAGYRERDFVLKLWANGMMPRLIDLKAFMEIAKYDPSRDEIVVEILGTTMAIRVVELYGPEPVRGGRQKETRDG